MLYRPIYYTDSCASAWLTQILHVLKRLNTSFITKCWKNITLYEYECLFFSKFCRNIIILLLISQYSIQLKKFYCCNM